MKTEMRLKIKPFAFSIMVNKTLANRIYYIVLLTWMCIYFLTMAQRHLLLIVLLSDCMNCFVTVK